MPWMRLRGDNFRGNLTFQTLTPKCCTSDIVKTARKPGYFCSLQPWCSWGHFPFQISHPIVFTNTRVLVRSAVLMFGSENMVPVITVLPRARTGASTHNPFIKELRIYLPPNENGEISRAIYLILFLPIIF